MKTLVLKVASNDPSINSGVLRLTENEMGNYSLEGDGFNNLSRKVKATLLSAIDFCLIGYDDTMNQQQDLRVTII